MAKSVAQLLERSFRLLTQKKQSRILFPAWLLALLIAVPPLLFAQEPTAKPVFKPEEIEQLVAPVALYPDSLLSQILIASTYPLEVVQADRWAKKNEKLKGDALTAALEKEKWDPSVKSLVNFPQVLSMMSEKLDWTQKLGDAFLAQQKEVMDSVQKLRAKAHAEGNLETTKEQKVIVQEKVIVIEPADPQVVYVPVYNTTVVYGAWPYPAYPPAYYYPPGYAAGAFVAGVAIGAAWGYAWGNCNWHGGDVDIDVNRNANINRNINRDQYRRDMQARGQGQGGRGKWQHDASHRKGVAYRDQGTAQKFDRGTANDAARSRDQYRGRDGQGRPDSARDGAGRDRARPDSAREGAAGRDRAREGAGGRDGAFGGMDQGRAASRDSQRGRSSQASMSGSRGGGGGGFGGGGGRGGGGRGGGGRR
jgi:uncharacterized membrane protein YgcG